jgi:hypothetical protein
LGGWGSGGWEWRVGRVSRDWVRDKEKMDIRRMMDEFRNWV